MNIELHGNYACVSICERDDRFLDEVLTTKSEFGAIKYDHKIFKEFHISLGSKKALGQIKQIYEERGTNEIELQPTWSQVYALVGYAWARNQRLARLNERESSFIRFVPDELLDLLNQHLLVGELPRSEWMNSDLYIGENDFEIPLHISLSNPEGNKYKSVKDPWSAWLAMTNCSPSH